jgi:hypothetical protein
VNIEDLKAQKSQTRRVVAGHRHLKVCFVALSTMGPVMCPHQRRLHHIDHQPTSVRTTKETRRRFPPPRKRPQCKELTHILLQFVTTSIRFFLQCSARPPKAQIGPGVFVLSTSRRNTPRQQQRSPALSRPTYSGELLLALDRRL